MNTFKFQHRGTEINKIQFNEIESYLEHKGLDVDMIFNQIADDQEFIYVSNGFVRGLHSENEIGEWHHYFVKDGNDFTAGKMNFFN